MRKLRRFHLAVFLAVALALGQYAAALHALGHATEQLSQKPGTPAKIGCDQCFACSQLSGGAPSAPVVLPAQAAESPEIAVEIACSPGLTRVVFLSRGPPVLS
ncbi:MAG TPA: hypothetical protein VFP36_10560 [Usitatibacter sp.]|nr:hypothetical protein [Usitatibacter sp.]